MRWKVVSLIVGMGILCASCGGKTPGQRLAELEKNAATTQNTLTSMDRRVATLESRTDTLAADMRAQSERTYEVRTKSGKKTGMIAYPMQLPTPPKMSTPAPDLIPVPQPAAKATVPLPLKPSRDVPMPPAMTGFGATQGASAPLSPPTQPNTPASVPVQPSAPAASAAPLPPPLSSAPPAARPAASTSQPRPSAAPATPRPAATPQAAPTHGNSSPALSLPPTQSPVIAAQHSTPVPPLQVSPGLTTVLPAQSSQAHPSATDNALALPPESGAAAGTSPAQFTQNAPSPRAERASTPTKLPAAAKGEDAAYKAALQLVNSGRRAEGRAKFTEFLKNYPNGRYAANAYYWMGESYYAERNYPEALMQFKQATGQFPRHHKSADALLKAGMTYQKMGDKENAALQFKALLADFPNSDAARLARSKGWGR